MTKQTQGHFRAVTSSPQDLAQLEAIMRETFTDTFANEQSAEDLNAFLDKNYNQWKFSGFTSGSNFKNCTLVAS